MEKVRIQVYYQKPYNWNFFLNFKRPRLIKDLEWVTEDSYGCNFFTATSYGFFNVFYEKNRDYFIVDITISDTRYVGDVVTIIKKMFDTEVDSNLAEEIIKKEFPHTISEGGIRIPGVFTPFEAAVSAICEYQVSVATSTSLLNKIVALCNKKSEERLIFPNPEDIIGMNFGALKTTELKKKMLKNTALWYKKNEGHTNVDKLLSIPCIDEWVVNYIKLRASNDTNVWFESDVGIKKVLKKIGEVNPLKVSPWASYLCLHLWNNLNKEEARSPI